MALGKLLRRAHIKQRCRGQFGHLLLEFLCRKCGARTRRLAAGAAEEEQERSEEKGVRSGHGMFVYREADTGGTAFFASPKLPRAGRTAVTVVTERRLCYEIRSVFRAAGSRSGDPATKNNEYFMRLVFNEFLC